MKYVKYIGMSISVFIVGIILISNGIILLGPHGAITDVEPSFKWASPYGDVRLLVDDDLGFENPLVDVPVKGNKFTLSDKLDFGKYYWRVDSSGGSSLIGQFVLDSMIKMDVEEDKLRNEGNTDVAIDTVTGRTILEIGEETDLQEGENIVSQT